MVADDGRTAFFSSHLLDEVEQMSDHVFMVDQGKLVLEGSLDEIKEQHQLLVLRLETAVSELPPIEGILSAEGQLSGDGTGRTWKVVCNGAAAHVRDAVKAFGGEVTQSRGASLQEIFIARVGRDRLPMSQE
jgi:ABC-2 type transport system ATP-binding protein